MRNKKSRLISSSFILLFSAILLVAAIFGVSFAWFTGSESVKFNGTTPLVALEVKQNGTTYNSEVYTVNSYASGDYNTNFTVKTTSTINVYIRARITCNWSDFDMSHEDVFDVMNFTLENSDGYTWYGKNGNEASDNAKIQNGWMYLKASSAIISANSTFDILSKVTIKSGKAMPANLQIQVYVEAVQANAVGLAKFGTQGTDYPSAWLA